MPAPRRLRRSAIEQAPDPFEHRSGLPTKTSNPAVRPSDQGAIDLQGGEATSSAAPAFGPGTVIAGNYRDEASQAKPNRPPPHPGGEPFTLGK